MAKVGSTSANKQVPPAVDPATNMASNDGLDLSAPENQPPATPALDSATNTTTTPQPGDGAGDPPPPDLPELDQAAELEEPALDGTAVQVNIVNAVELKPDSKYIILLDENTYSREEAGQILASVRAIGINNAVALMTSQAHSVQIIEQEKS